MNLQQSLSTFNLVLFSAALVELAISVPVHSLIFRSCLSTSYSLLLLLLCSHSPSDVPLEPQRNVPLTLSTSSLLLHCAL